MEYAPNGVGCAVTESVPADASCSVARSNARAAELSLALFAPGWSVECGDASNCADEQAAAQADRAFWERLAIAKLYRRAH